MALTQISTQGIKDGTITGTDLATNVDLVDNQKLRLGTGNDLQIYHDGTHSYLNNSGTGNLVLYGNGTNSIVLQPVSGENSIVANSNSSVELFHDNSKTFETTASGVSITGGFVTTGNSTVNDNGKISFGTGNDLQIYHDGSHSRIDEVGTGNLKIQSNNAVIISKGASENLAQFIADGAVELYHDNVKSLETTTEGIEIKKTASGQTARLKIEATNGGQAGIELKTSLSGTNRAARIDMYNQNALQWSIFNDYQQNGTNDFSIRHGAEPAIRALTDGAVELYYDNSKKLETTSGGVEVSCCRKYNSRC